MKVGDIGVLQNMYNKYCFLNGVTAEITEVFSCGDILDIQFYGAEEKTYCAEVDGYIVAPAISRRQDYPEFLIKKHQIRPLSDPDAEQITETEEESHV